MIIPLSTAIIVSNALSGTIDRSQNEAHLALLNKYRNDILGPGYDLVFDKYLMEAAEIRVQELFLNWGHERPVTMTVLGNAGGGQVSQQESNFFSTSFNNGNDVFYRQTAENIAYSTGTLTAQDAVQGFINSIKHNANMTDRTVNSQSNPTTFVGRKSYASTTFGVAHYIADNGTEYWVQLFGSMPPQEQSIVKTSAIDPFGQGALTTIKTTDGEILNTKNDKVIYTSSNMGQNIQSNDGSINPKANTGTEYSKNNVTQTPTLILNDQNSVLYDYPNGSNKLVGGGTPSQPQEQPTQPSGGGTSSGSTKPTNPTTPTNPQNPSGGGTNTGDNQNQGSGGSTDTGNQNTGSNGSNTGNQGSQSGSGSNTGSGSNNTNTNKPTQKPSTDKEESKEENKPTTPSKPSQSEKDKAEQEKQEAQKAEQERLEAERLEKERLEAEEKARQEAEQKAAEEKAKQEAEQKAKEEAMKAVVVAMMAEEIRQSNPQFKALSEGTISAVTTVLAAADTAATSGMDEASKATSANAATLGAGQTAMAAFGATGGGSMRYKSGSHVDVKGVNVLAGVGFSREFNEGKIMIAPFVEAGWSKYNTYNSFNNAASVEGDGDSSFVGFGALLRYDISGASHPYIEASVRAGELKNKYNAGSVYDRLGRVLEYTTHTPYFSAHVGAGYIFDLGDGLSLDLGAKYLYTHVKSDKVNVAGDKFSFGAVNSHRLRASAKVEKELNENVSVYGGMAYEYEFKGSADASINGRTIKAPSIKGGSGMAEVGFGWYLTKNVRLDISAQGWVGKKQGVNGNIGIKINF